ncbi:undecaprenyl-diphosphatase [Stackebrandtia albiflava]|uniref:Undecaprenyl-diphosphatase n=1 Tax=Stackebrandtia albiflava TaxID=406432 RepID=A0A562UL29_9ACTN|nr:undecaprenyl-diphosphate phosphatase [Stackebrandtia albiflava]TWJ06317.1 undecaprenyl-diphosphatase [Stackebrandtia albiflava]
MEIWQAVVLGIVEGLTEFLPVSSTGHLTVVSQWIGLDADSSAVIGFNAIIQTAAVVALLIYFAKDIWRITAGFFRGLFSARHRSAFEYRFGWYVIIGSVPIVLAGLFLEDSIDSLFNLWFVAFGMIGWSFVLWFAEYAATNQRGEAQINLKDALFVGILQCVALFPGVSRSGASMSAGMLRDLDRVSATRLAFFLGIPALTGAGVLEGAEAFNQDVGAVPVIVGMVVSAGVAYAAVAWLLKFVSRSSLMPFVWYRIGFGVVLMILLGTGLVQAT